MPQPSRRAPLPAPPQRPWGAVPPPWYSFPQWLALVLCLGRSLFRCPLLSEVPPSSPRMFIPLLLFIVLYTTYHLTYNKLPCSVIVLLPAIEIKGMCTGNDFLICFITAFPPVVRRVPGIQWASHKYLLSQLISTSCMFDVFVHSLIQQTQAMLSAGM